MRAARRRSFVAWTAEEPLPGSDDGRFYFLGARLRAREPVPQTDEIICECELITRERLEEAMRRRGHRESGRHPPYGAARDGPCQGGFCTYRATGILHARSSGSITGLRTPRWSQSSGGTLEGRPSDPLRRPGAAGPARRLDLPGPARRAALADVTYDAIVIGAGVAGLTAALRLADEGKRVLVTAKGVGSTHLAPATIDVLGFDPEPVARPAEALPAFTATNPEHPYAHLQPGTHRRKRRVVQGTSAGDRLPGRPGGRLPSPDRGRRGEAVRTRPGDDGSR